MYAAAECIVRGHNAKEGTLRQNELIMLVLAKRTGLIWGFRNLFQKFKILFFFEKKTCFIADFWVFPTLFSLRGHFCTTISKKLWLQG